ncbi:penicillin-binding transpeptidase domain-containing protein [Cellulomonas cellasea]|uniref:peptidoglycan D,D-transpeptidase FtsI family protein n=1 Tax=Cellulomonas cellasea TaxID=43670 RepID=UPI0025A3D0D9|nr:penicillin-binding transpeptidase domain-containing protein [Cellulomonas cellasea]MDM8085156.1 penicillin-binding transpeptidase domain-containing protein [Cellulomonas cellasea]
MNTPLRRLSLVVVTMFLALMVGTSWVQFVQADALNNDSRNVRTLYREFGNPRGPIIVAGTPIAWSEPVDDAFGYQRIYAPGAMYSNVTGFYSIVNGRTGIESAENDVLTGSSDSLFLSRIQDLITGKQPQGSSVELTLNPAAQQAAWDALGDQVGAVVALDPTTGAVLALVSTPGFDPNSLATHDTAAASTAYKDLNAAANDPLVDKAISGKTYPPGSTFKLVTAAAALESGQYSADTVLAAPDVLSLPQTTATIGNYGGASCGSGGQTTLSDALRVSCNTAFAQLGMDLGADALREQAEKFGFSTPLSIPMKVTESYFPPNEDLDPAKLAKSAIGQQDVRTTPMQMAMVSAAIANGGKVMTPYTVATVRTADLDVISETEPSVFSTAISAGTASTLRDMMVSVVDSGTGTAAKIPGVQVAGKTGTAETTAEQSPHAWFTGFAPANDPKVAVAVIVEHGGSTGNEATGGKVAAPIAKAVMQAVLGQ